MEIQPDKILEKEIDHIYNEVLANSKSDQNGIYWETIDYKGVPKISEDIYAGQSGVILFLIEYYKLRNNDQVLDIIDSASIWLYKYCNQNPTTKFSFYTGRVGSAYTLMHSYKTTGNKLISNAAIELIDNVRLCIDPKKMIYDLLNGLAGTILGVLYIYDEYRTHKIEQDLIYLIKELIRGINIRDYGFFWDKMTHMSRPLCGMSHGSSGIALTFLELGKYFNNTLFIEISKNGFSHDHYFYNNKANNWPDFRKGFHDEEGFIKFSREYSKQNYSFFVSPSYMNAWCHGAPGIGLANIRAFDILKTNIYKKNIINALKGTFKSFGNFHNITSSLCHGLLGNNIYVLELYKLYQKPRHLDIYKQNCINSIIEKNRYGYYKSGLRSISTGDVSFFNGISGIGYAFIQGLKPFDTFSILLPTINNSSHKGLEEFTMDYYKKEITSRLYPLTSFFIQNHILNTSITDSNTMSEINFSNIVNELTIQFGDFEVIYYFEKEKNRRNLKILSYAFLETRKRIHLRRLGYCIEYEKFEKCRLALDSEVKMFKVGAFTNTMYFVFYRNTTEYKLEEIDNFNYTLLQLLNKPTIFSILTSQIPNYETGLVTKTSFLKRIKELVTNGIILIN